MREIRAWHRGHQKMYRVRSINFQNGQLTLICPNHPPGYIIASMKQCNLLDCTGLKDKNGVEIYEGDILAPNNREIRFGTYDTPLEQGNGFYTLCHNAEYPQIPFSFSERQAEASEVIGNIYENKELLI